MYRYLLTKIWKSKGKTRLYWLMAVVAVVGGWKSDKLRPLLAKTVALVEVVSSGEPITGKQLKEILAQPVSRQQPGSQDGSGVGSGPVRVYFTRPGTPPDASDNIARALVNYINQTKTALDVAAFELDNRAITDALVAAVRRGVRVRLVTETSYLGESGVVALQAVGVPVVDDRRDGSLMHNKFMVFDNQAVWTGSMNFTENCAYLNNNHGLYLDDASLAANYATKFTWMFDQRKFGGAPSRTTRIPYPVVKLRDGTTVENYFSTHDRVASRVIERVEQARTTLHFLAFSFTHDGIARAMLGRGAAGVEVLGVFEKSQTAGGYSEFDKFRAAGGRVQAYLDANPRNMHHKAIVIDGETTIAGSFNFSENADKHNDENLVIIGNRDVARQFEEEFQRVYSAAKSAEAGVVNSARR